MNNLTKEETAFLEQRTLEANKRGHEIISYWHCSKCCEVLEFTSFFAISRETSLQGRPLLALIA